MATPGRNRSPINDRSPINSTIYPSSYVPASKNVPALPYPTRPYVYQYEPQVIQTEPFVYQTEPIVASHRTYIKAPQYYTAEEYINLQKFRTLSGDIPIVPVVDETLVTPHLPPIAQVLPSIPVAKSSSIPMVAPASSTTSHNLEVPDPRDQAILTPPRERTPVREHKKVIYGRHNTPTFVRTNRPTTPLQTTVLSASMRNVPVGNRPTTPIPQTHQLGANRPTTPIPQGHQPLMQPAQSQPALKQTQSHQPMVQPPQSQRSIMHTPQSQAVQQPKNAPPLQPPLQQPPLQQPLQQPPLQQPSLQQPVVRMPSTGRPVTPLVKHTPRAPQRLPANQSELPALRYLTCPSSTSLAPVDKASSLRTPKQTLHVSPRPLAPSAPVTPTVPYTVPAGLPPPVQLTPSIHGLTLPSCQNLSASYRNPLQTTITKIRPLSPLVADVPHGVAEDALKAHYDIHYDQVYNVMLEHDKKKPNVYGQSVSSTEEGSSLMGSIN